jgi:hypothetical protein
VYSGPDDYEKTIGVEFGIRRFSLPSCHKRVWRMEVWDLSGGCKFWSASAAYIRGGDMLAFVFDFSDPSSWGQSFELAKRVLVHMKSHHRIVCIGSKMDKRKTEADIYQAASELQSILKMSAFPMVFCCSSKDVDCVVLGFANLRGFPFLFSEVCSSAGVPEGRVRIDPALFNAWLWDAEDPTSSLLQKATRFITNILAQSVVSDTTPKYFLQPYNEASKSKFDFP